MAQIKINVADPELRRHLRNFADYLLLERDLSELSIEAYLSDIERFLNEIVSQGRDYLTFSSEVISDYLNAHQDLSARTVARFLCSLRTYVNFLISHGHREDDPAAAIVNPRLPQTLPKTLSEEAVTLILESPDISYHTGLRDKAMLETLYATGLRVSELVGLRFDSLNLTDGYVLIRGKGDKERIVPLGENALYWLATYISSAERARKDPQKSCPFVFLSGKGLGPITRVAFWYRVKTYVRQVGILEDPSPHTFRHAFATHLLNHDADLRSVQMLLGHSSLTTTQIYTHVALTRMQDIYKKAHPLGVDN